MIAFLYELLDKTIKQGVTEHKGYRDELGEMPFYVPLEDVIELRNKLKNVCSREDMDGTMNVNPIREEV